VDRPRLLLRLVAVLGALGALGACGGGRRPAVEAAPRELLVEVLPPDARVSLDGRPLGAGGAAVPAPAPGAHVLRVEAEGYEAVERPLPEGDLAGVRVGEALRPRDLEAAGPLDYDVAGGLAQAAAHLARSGGRPRDAIAYAERALAIDRNAALAHRALGDAREALGDLRRAAASWTEYLRLAPGAPDARAVAARIEAAGGVPPAR
jgi:tetratricopeptide (TPR) repeat protein